MKQLGEQQTLYNSLSAFESQLHIPVIPGELQSWAEAAADALSTLAPLIRHQINEHHREQFRDIRSEDAGLAARIDRLEIEDKSVIAELDELQHLCDRLCERAGQIEPDEQRVKHAVNDLINKGISLVLRVRKQEMAIQTWFVEAFSRDRGKVD